MQLTAALFRSARTGQVSPKRQHLESQEQRLYVQRFRLDPKTRDLPACAIPNGGQRSAREAAILKAEGVSAGAPDWMLFVRGSNRIGLALEFKSPTGSGRVTPAQALWHERLRLHGWAVHIVTSAHEAWEVTMQYLNGSGTP